MATATPMTTPKKMYLYFTKIYNARAQPLFCSLNLLFCGVLVAVAVVVCLRSLLIRHENGAFQKRSSNRTNLKTPAFRFLVDRKHLKTELFENDGVTIIT